MGRRGRVVLRRIEDRVRRGICFRKRLAELEKKAEELAVLCGAHVGFVVLSCSDDAHPHHFAAPATLENIVERYEHSQAAQKGVHGRCILQKNKSKDCQVPRETIDKGPINDDMRPIDETDISTLNMDQISQIERLLEYELRWTRARKVVADRIARLQKKQQHPCKKEIKFSSKQNTKCPDGNMDKNDDATHVLHVQKKPATAETESNSTDMPSDHEKKQVAGGSQQNAEEEVEVVLSHSLSLGTSGRGDGGGGGAAEQRHRTPPAVDLNVPCRDAGPLQ